MTRSAKAPFFHLPARDRQEEHRAATPIELMFDLASVIAIASAATGLHHGIAEAHYFSGFIGFLYSFFMIWLAWMNYTWLASAYDNGSMWFRTMSMAIMVGALIMAAGIPAAFSGEALYLALVGFIVMRLCLVLLWLSAALGDEKSRPTALRYALGIVVAQIYWTAIILYLPAGSNIALVGFAIGVGIELVIPTIAEKSSTTPWHKHHIIERFSLLNIIVLGECFLAIVMAFRASLDHGALSWELIEIGVLCSVITFGLWAIYFADVEHLRSEESKHVFLWGYGHFALFASGAAAGAGFAVLIELATHHSDISERAAHLSVAIPVAIYIAALWLIRERLWMTGAAKWMMPVSAGLVIAAALVNIQPLLAITVILMLTLIFHRTSKSA